MDASRKPALRLDDPGRYFSGSGVAFTVSQFLSARLMFAAAFFRHSVVQYFVWLTYSLPFTMVKASGSTVSLWPSPYATPIAQWPSYWAAYFSGSLTKRSRFSLLENCQRASCHIV